MSLTKKTAKKGSGDQAKITELDDKIHEVNDKVAAMGEEMAEIKSGISEILKTMQAPKTIGPARFESEEQYLGGEGAAVMGVGDDGENVIIKPAPLPLEHPAMKAKLETEEFMKEMVTVEIQTTNEDDAQQVFEVSVNGRSVVFVRGETRTVPRYIVEGLARAKPVHYDNQEYTRPDGVRDVRWPKRNGLRFPFSVIEDKNPNGRAWLKSILSQP